MTFLYQYHGKLHPKSNKTTADVKLLDCWHTFRFYYTPRHLKLLQQHITKREFEVL